jgi:hypothetical protein
MSEPLPDLPTTCWPVDWSCVPDEDDIDPVVKARAEALATSALRSLTGYQVGGCPIQVRPCSLGCGQASGYQVYPITGQPGVGPWINTQGRWVNGCGCGTSCSCTALSEVILPGPVGRIDEVMVDGVVLAATDYRVDNGNRLVRLDGDLWPVCQDMSAAPDAVGAFAVTYLRGIVPDGAAAYAAGVLAFEFVKACGGSKCGLPKNVTQVARSGITWDIEPGTFPSNATGIFPVDAWLRTVNPYAVTLPAAVFSIDRPQTRVATFGGY